jgi:site-specific recombinase XerC
MSDRLSRYDLRDLLLSWWPPRLANSGLFAQRALSALANPESADYFNQRDYRVQTALLACPGGISLQPLSSFMTVTDLHMPVWRSVRAGGDTKTQKSRRTLEVPNEVARAFKLHHTKQAARRLRAGETWQDNDLVFCTRNGKPLAAGNVRRAFRSITMAAGIGEDWTPRELRHTFVSIMSDNDVPIETIADLVGHRTTIVTQTVYRHQLRPVIETGATAMNSILNRQKNTGSA